MDMMPSLFASLRILPTVFLREYPLPAPFLRGFPVFPIQGVKQEHAAPAVGQVAFVDGLDLPEMVLERDFNRFGKHRDAIFRALAASHTHFSRATDSLRSCAGLSLAQHLLKFRMQLLPTLLEQFR